MTRWIEHHFGWVMLLGCVAGLVFPFGHFIPDTIVIPSLAMVTFISLFNIDTALSRRLIANSCIFTALRFAVLPVCLWYLASLLIPDYALAILLLAALPAGVSSTAFTQIFGGNVLLAVSITLISSMLAVGLIPLYVYLLEQQTIHINIGALFLTLFICVILPMIIFRFLKKNHSLRKAAAQHGKATSILLIACNVFVVSTKQRETLLAEPLAFAEPFGVALACYLIFALCGMWKPTPQNITYSTTSIFNNCTLGVTIALLYFPSNIILTMAAAVLIWIILPMPLQYILRAVNRKISQDAANADVAK